ncbi:toll/interleukin-1 receptor domain-containing protein [Amycolatopsis sp., V23-08]|uniref:Toll/interleukin-1 receptor domain-containing protein n=1 Tax=Amycolatopsis heterodermiae TaxID=3110235 RepID=A0ABU5RM05_9PSEU|nr:toll/interleukin-1 receptor domain-containing protein [Amycolatopsis sp., V23-08]MEA5366579.1 toll/interleukin-1 receptor domain-containing protein [Amycolatopsis sp., V23-08]
MNKVFLCYRSGDDSYAATLLDEKLSDILGRESVFRASRSISPGESYSQAIETALEACETVLVIIGPTWRERMKTSDSPLSSPPEDWVRREIVIALRLNKRIIPILLSRATRLTVEDLPADISEIAYKQYLRFEHRNIELDLKLLAQALHTPQSHVVQSSEKTMPPRIAKEFTVRQERTQTGRLELDILQRGFDGAIIGRLTGRGTTEGLTRMVNLINQLTSAVREEATPAADTWDSGPKEPKQQD